MVSCVVTGTRQHHHIVRNEIDVVKIGVGVKTVPAWPLTIAQALSGYPPNAAAIPVVGKRSSIVFVPQYALS